MKKVNGRFAVALVVSFFVVVPAEAVPEPRKVVGRWELDPTASVDDLNGLSRWSSSSKAEREDLRGSLERRAEDMSLAIAEDSVTLETGSRQMTFPCSTRYRHQFIELLACTSEETQFTITVLHWGGEKIKLLSSGTDDLDVYVWRRAD